jgi:hypothetical protein
MYLILMDLFPEGSWKKVSRRLVFGLVGNEKLGTRIPIHTYRTHNRNRSLSFINSDQLVNVNKGSRQIEPVTLGKRLALMIGNRVNVTLSSTWATRAKVAQTKSLGKAIVTYSRRNRKGKPSFISPYRLRLN